MGRKSSLTEKQWSEIGGRLLKGEAARALAREFGVSEAAIRKRFGAQTKQIKDVANQLVAAESAFSALPIGAQISARTLADELKEISMHLAGAARYGAATAHRLSGIAHNKAGEIDDAEPLDDHSAAAHVTTRISMTDAVRKQSAEAAKLNEDCALVAALLGGTKTMRAAGKKYLPQWPGEDSESYDLRLAVATLFPAYARTIDVLSAKPFSKPVTLGEDVPERLKPWLQNVDLSGRDLHSFLSEITQEAMGYGFAGILVDFPKAGNLVTKADEQAAGVRPYFVQVHVQNVLGWLPKNATSLDGLTQLRLLESVSEPNGDFDTKEIEQVRVLGRGTWQTWRQSETGSKKEWTLHEEGITSLKIIPFVPVYGKRLGYMQATPPLLELAHSNVEHWQSKSDQQNILHIARVPILFAKMLEGSDIAVGAGTAVKSDSPEGDLKFVEHGGKAIEAGRLSILDLEDRMRQAGAELLVIKPGNVTESQTLADNEQGACALQKIAGNVEDAGDQALQLLADWVNEPEGGHITIFKDFGAASLAEASAELLFKSVANNRISGETYFNELQRRGIVSPDLKWEDEQERIQSAPPDLAGE